MKLVRFKLIHRIKREEFYYWKNVSPFSQRCFIRVTKIYLWEKAKLEVEYFKNKTFVSKWLHDYYNKKNLIENYTYLDIDIVFYEEFNLARILTPYLIGKMKKEGIY